MPDIKRESKGGLVAVMLVVAILGAAAMWTVREAAPPEMETSPYEYRPERFRSISSLKDNFLEGHPIQPDSGPLSAVAVNSFGAICLGTDEGLLLMRSDGTIVGKKKLNKKVTCLTFSPQGDIFAGLEDHIAIFDDALEKVAEWPAFDSKSLLTSIIVFRTDIFVADSGLRTVLRYYPDGTFHNRLGDADPERKIPGLIAPSPCIDLAKAGNSRIFVTNPGRLRISTYNFRGDLLVSFGKAGNAEDELSGCCNPAAIASLPDGTIVAAEKHIVRLKRFDRRGRFIGIVADINAFDQKTVFMDLATDHRSRIYLLEIGSDKVRVFERKDNDFKYSTPQVRP